MLIIIILSDTKLQLGKRSKLWAQFAHLMKVICNHKKKGETVARVLMEDRE